MDWPMAFNGGEVSHETPTEVINESKTPNVEPVKEVKTSPKPVTKTEVKRSHKKK